MTAIAEESAEEKDKEFQALAQEQKVGRILHFS